MKLPQIITDNLNDRIVDKFFCLIKLVSDKDIMNEQMKLFLTTLSDYDGSNSDPSEREEITVKINDAYIKLSLIQQKIVLQTFKLANATHDITSISEKYLFEVEMLKKTKPTESK